jgi:hypothetical protein
MPAALFLFPRISLTFAVVGRVMHGAVLPHK